MRIRGAKTARRAARWLRSYVTPGAIVLGYHRVAESDVDVFEQCVSPRHFAEQLEAIRTLATPLTLTDMVGRAAAGRLPRRAVAVTFDDGYADLLDTAVPLLRQAGIPATVFAVSGLLGSEFWWDRLECALPRPVDRSPAAGASLRALHLRLRSLPPGERERALSELGARNGSPGNGRPRCATREELRALAAEPLIEIGGHTRTHEWLPSLSAAGRRDEMRHCKTELEQIVGGPVRGFAFPYGGESPALGEEVRSAGYEFACGSRNGVLFAGDNPFLIPRWWVRNEDGDSFARWLRTWLHV